MLRGVRGAVSVPENQGEAIQEAVKNLIEALLEANRIRSEEIVAVFFTVTPDLTALNPARAIRMVRDDWSNVPMLCSQEPVIEGMLPRCIRVLLQWHPSDASHHHAPVYLGEARQLRPELLPPMPPIGP
jgi:chorismate mutase